MINLNGLNTDYYDSGKIRSEFYQLNGCLHRIDGPAYIAWYENGRKKVERYYINGISHREIIYYEDTDHMELEVYYYNDALSRLHGQAIIHYDKNGLSYEERYIIKNELIEVNSIEEFKKYIKLLMFK